MVKLRKTKTCAETNQPTRSRKWTSFILSYIMDPVNDKQNIYINITN